MFGLVSMLTWFDGLRLQTIWVGAKAMEALTKTLLSLKMCFVRHQQERGEL